MDLEKAMIALAGAMGSSAADTSETLTAKVRSAVLNLEAGRPCEDLPADQRQEIIDWLDAKRRLTLDLPGSLYEEMLGRMVVAAEVGFEIRHVKSAHRQSGAYYTVEPLVRYMVNRAAHWTSAPKQVLDPACGSGAFLQGVSEKFTESVKLVGFESDPTSAAICQGRLPHSHVHVLNALTAEVNERFDLVIGNPPYISHGLRGAPVAAAHVHKLLKELYPQTAQYKLSTYPLFVERGLQLLRPGGILSYVIPDSFLTGRYFVGLRKLLLANRILEITLIQQDFWRHGRVGQSVVLVVQKRPPVGSDLVTVRICKSLDDLEANCGDQVSQSELSWGEQKRFRLVPNLQDRQFLEAIEGGRPTQPGREFFQTYSGLIARAGQDSLFQTSSSIGPVGKLIRSGRQIDRYSTLWLGHEISLNADLFKSGFTLSYYQGPKLFMRQTADSLRVSFDDQGYYCLNNIHLVIPRGNVNPRALLAILNSHLLNRYYGLITMESGRLYPQVDLDLVRELPFPIGSGCDAGRLADLTVARERANPEGLARTNIEAAIDQLVAKVFDIDLSTYS